MPENTRSVVTFRALPHMITEDSTELVDFLWKISLSVQYPCPGWSGMMQMVHNESRNWKAAITFLSLINLQPNDPTCIYSTMMFVSKQAKMYNFTPELLTNCYGGRQTSLSTRLQAVNWNQGCFSLVAYTYELSWEYWLSWLDQVCKRHWKTYKLSAEWYMDICW